MKVFHHYDIVYRKAGDNKLNFVEPPAYGWVADPFLVKYKERIFLFAEIFLFLSERNGVIGYCEYIDGKFSNWIITMDKHWHLSYPNVFVRNGELYMVPESYQLEEVALYRLKEFPDKWEKERVILDNVEYCDSTFLNDNGEEYMFTFERGRKSPEGRGLLYKLSTGEFQVLSDSLEGTRCGGKIIYENGKKIRVGQDCVMEYGKGLIFYEIESIWPKYKEKEIGRLYVEDLEFDRRREYTGVHTYNRISDLEVFDLRYASSTLEEEQASDRVHKVFVDKYLIGRI